MKPLQLLVVLIIFIINSSTAQIIRPFALRYSNPSVRGNIVYVSNNIITTLTGNTTEAPPGGSSTNTGTGVNININATSFFPFGSTWKYRDNNTRPVGWETSGFSDAAWSSGAGQLGYNQGDETTVVSYGPSSGTKYITTLFRKSVTIPNPALFASFTMNVNYDDGFVVYVNGVEVNRTNMPAGAVTNSTLASSAVSSVVSLTIPTSAFSSGTNVIAVEIHQNIASSSDLSFDMSLAGNDAVTFNSSSADLALTTCSQVMWAGLYWGAGQGASGTNTAWITNETTCKLKIPGAASYTTITSTQTDYHNSTLIPGYAHTGYKCFADITSLINTSNANGTYTVGNITSSAGITDAYGGWTIVIAYTNATAQIRNLSVYDGNAAVKTGSGNADVSISGFLTPPSGPVTCELGAVVYDGDRTSLDSFMFKQGGAASFYNLTANATSNLNDMWNSTISYKGAVVTTRNPAHQNTLGYDADIIDLPNTSNAQLGNNKTSATVRFSSPSENYIVQVLSTSISQFNPSIKFVKSSTDVNGGSLVGGDILRYRVDYKNIGADGGTNAYVTDNIPAGSTYKPGTLKINGVAKTDASADDQSEYDFTNNKVVFRVGSGANSSTGGLITSNNTATDSGYVEFDVYVASSCSLTSCGAALSNSARIDYIGSTSLSALSDSSGTLSSGCFTLGPLVNPISGTCYVPKDTIMVNTCPSTSVTIPGTFYAGYRFYSAKPFTNANLFNTSTAITTTRTIYAYGLNAGCQDTVTIRINISSCPDIDNDRDGIPDYFESNLASTARLDHDADGIPNYRDTNYPGFIDLNTDGINDNFDPGADSDNDGIPNFLDTNFAGFVDTNNDGVNDNFDTDKDGIPNYLDIDSDNDGIPDQIEAQATSGYTFASGIDSDADGLDNTFDNYVGIGGNGINVIDSDGDLIPDYLDSDSDGDGFPDLYEGNDLNFNNILDDNVALTGLDTDGDGLDNFFDNNNSSIEGTSRYMGTGGSTSGDVTPGSITTLQHTSGSNCATERDWRCTMFVLECNGLILKATADQGIANIEWHNNCNQPVDHFILERSINGSAFTPVATIPGREDTADRQLKYNVGDNISAIHGSIIYYRIVSYSKTGKSFYSGVVSIILHNDIDANIRLVSNPVRSVMEVFINAAVNSDAEIRLFNLSGVRMMTVKQKIQKGETKVKLDFPNGSPVGFYYLHVKLNDYLKVIKLNHTN
jgi:uncharacterized repeat protein (TIGR01451 family)